MDWSQAVALLVAAATVTFGLVPCFLYFRSRRLRILLSIGALVPALAAVGVGMCFTGWLLVGPGHPNLGDWIGFAVVNAIIAAAAGIPGGLAGLVVGLLGERKAAGAQPPKSEVEVAKGDAKGNGA